MIDFEAARVRSALQKKINDLVDRDGRAAALYGTGTGKTKIGLSCIKPGETWDIVVYMTDHIRGWYAEIEKWYPDLDDHVNIYCYESLKKNLDNGNHLIMDECHHATTEIRLGYLRQKITDQTKVILLSATVNDRDKEDFAQFGFMGYHFVKFDIDQSVNAGLVPDYDLWVYRVEMDELETKQYRFKKWKYNEAKDNRRQKDIQMWMYNIKRHLSGLKSKERAAKLFLKRIPEGKRVIVMGGSIAQIEAMVPYPHHSKNKKLNNLQKYKDGLIDIIGAVRMLDEGTNVLADVGVATMLDAEPRRLVQRLGRLLRRDPGNPDKKAVMVVFVAKDTFEQEWWERNAPEFNDMRVNYSDLPNKLKY